MIKDTLIKSEYDGTKFVSCLAHNEEGTVDGFSLYIAKDECDTMLCSVEYEDGTATDNLSQFRALNVSIRDMLKEFKLLVNGDDINVIVEKDLGHGDFVKYSKLKSEEDEVVIISLSIGNEDDESVPVWFVDNGDITYINNQLSVFEYVLDTSIKNIDDFVIHLVS